MSPYNVLNNSPNSTLKEKNPTRKWPEGIKGTSPKKKKSHEKKFQYHSPISLGKCGVKPHELSLNVYLKG